MNTSANSHPPAQPEYRPPQPLLGPGLDAITCNNPENSYPNVNTPYFQPSVTMQNEYARYNLPDPPKCLSRPGKTWTEQELNEAREWAANQCYRGMIAHCRVMLGGRYTQLSLNYAEDVTHHFFEKFPDFIKSYDPGMWKTNAPGRGINVVTNIFSSWIRTYLWGGRGKDGKRGGGIGDNYFRKIIHDQMKCQSLDEMESSDDDSHFQFRDPSADPETTQRQQEMRQALMAVIQHVEETFNERDKIVFQTIDLPVEQARYQLWENEFECSDNYISVIRHSIRCRLRKKFPNIFP